MATKIDIKDIELLVFDFDGVLTDNKVYLNSKGDEFVCCSRSDGLAFDLFKKINLKVLILSTEKNSVVRARAKKLRADVIQGVENKLNALLEYTKKNNISISNVCFVGNDINDLRVMEACGFAFCPNDSHCEIKSRFHTLSVKGGDGVAREIIEDIFNVNVIDFF